MSLVALISSSTYAGTRDSESLESPNPGTASFFDLGDAIEDSIVYQTIYAKLIGNGEESENAKHMAREATKLWAKEQAEAAALAAAQR